MPNKPMLAAPFEESRLVFPLYIQPKLDGIRATNSHGTAFSRSLKTIPNQAVQEYFRTLPLQPVAHLLDGELMVGDWTAKDVYRKTNSGVMSHDGEPDFTFAVFDFQDTTLPYVERRIRIIDKVNQLRQAGVNRFHVLDHKLVYNMEELLAAEMEFLEQGYEGAILRKPNGKYKFGRSTAIELNLMKLKRFQDDEAVIVGFEEKCHNANEAFTNELGYTARSSHQANQVPMGVLGALVCRLLVDGESTDIEFNIGTGFDEGHRSWVWNHRDELLGKIVKFKHFTIGAKDKPRHPVFLGFRDPADLVA